MLDGKLLTLWTIRLAAVLYAASVMAWLRHRDRSARLTWTLGCLLYVAHVACAFNFYHHWTHWAAYQDTSRRTAELLGLHWGGGIYFNYIFTIVWVVDVFWWWRGVALYRNRPQWMNTSVHTFFAFMFFNAAVVFAAGPVRWLGVVATAALALVWRQSRARIAASASSNRSF